MWSARAVVMFPTGVKLALPVGPDVVDDVGLAVVDADAMELFADGTLPQEIRVGASRKGAPKVRVRKRVAASIVFILASRHLVDGHDRRHPLGMASPYKAQKTEFLAQKFGEAPK
jgi:hypothetical protein